VASARSGEEDVTLPPLLFVLVADPEDTAEPGDEADDPDDPVVACVAVFGVIPVVLVPLFVPPRVEPGRTAATAPAAITLAIPTPAVVAESRRIPRRRSTPGGIGRSAGLARIGVPFSLGAGRGTSPPLPQNRQCPAHRSEHSGVLLNRL
jgi:hypothetical protein